jgi:hypothetical protein
MKQRLYGVVIACVAIAILMSFLGPTLAKLMAASVAPHSGQGGRLEALYLSTIFGPMSGPAQPLPLLASRFVPSSFLGIYSAVATALVFGQALLLLRRAWISVRARAVVAPPGLNFVWKVALGLGLFSWCLGTVAVLLPRLVVPFLGIKSVEGLGIALATFSVFIVPYFWLLSSNVLGPSFFVLELLSIRREGLVPPPNSAAAQQKTSKVDLQTRTPFATRKSRFAAILAVVAVAVMAVVWSIFPTGLIHERLCETRAGEHVYEKARAKNYLFVGEGASTDGLHLHHAMDDVVARRVEFIEVLKVPGNNHQAHVFGRLMGNRDPKDSVFRISLGAIDSPDCLQAHGMYGMRETLQAGACLRFFAVTKPESRYRVEAVNNEQATWFTPSLRSDGARVFDSEREVTLGEDLIFANTSVLAYFVLGERRMECPTRFGRSPAGLHRKVLLGAE